MTKQEMLIELVKDLINVLESEGYEETAKDGKDSLKNILKCKEK
jgi:hypothetical protein